MQYVRYIYIYNNATEIEKFMTKSCDIDEKVKTQQQIVLSLGHQEIVNVSFKVMLFNFLYVIGQTVNKQKPNLRATLFNNVVFLIKIEMHN